MKRKKTQLYFLNVIKKRLKVVKRMKKSIEEKLKSYPNVRNMLNGLPEDLRYIFMPVTIEDLQELEMNILAFKKRTTDRKSVV